MGHKRRITLQGSCSQRRAIPFFLATFILTSQALILNIPQPPDGFDAILPNGPANVSWTLESGDPSEFTLEIQNNVTLDSFEFARSITASSLFLVKNLSDVDASPHYFMQAVSVSNITDVITNSPVFAVAGAVASTTNPISSSTASSTASGSTISGSTASGVTSPSVFASTSSTSATQTSTSAGSFSKSGAPVGGIVGGVVGGIAGLGVIAALLFFLRRRRRIHPHNRFEIDVDNDETASNAFNYSDDPNANIITPMLQTEPSAPTTTKAVLVRDLHLLRDQKAAMRQRLAQSSAGPNGSVTEGSSVSGRVTDPETQRQLEAMSQRILELEEREQSLMREVAELAPPDYASAADMEEHLHTPR